MTTADDPRTTANLDELKQLADDVQNLPMKENDHWYVINEKWWQSFLTALNNGKLTEVNEIDNEAIVRSNRKGEYSLKERLSEGVDFVTIPEEAFKKLRDIFGLDNEAKDFLPRKVIKRNGELIVQVYPRIVNFVLARDVNMKTKMVLEPNDTLETIRDRVISEFNLTSEANEVRFYIKNDDQMELVDLSQSVDTYFDTTQTVTVDTKVDEEWFVRKAATPPKEQSKALFGNSRERASTRGSDASSSEPESSVSLDTSGGGSWALSPIQIGRLTALKWRLFDAGDNVAFYLRVWLWYACMWFGHLLVPFRRNRINRHLVIGYPQPPVPRMEGISTGKTPYPPGICGLANLGNTCFMASALQCLSNIPALRDYFLSKKYENDINKINPLGTQGQLALAFYDLIFNLWNGHNSTFNPRRIKAVIGQFAPRFSGFAQQDSHELMAYVLDGLHEDLNRIKHKPYIEDDDEWAKMPEQEYAKKSWEVYKMRNDSIIVDQLQGQIKSTLVCPVCAKISIKFDPFCLLSLPLPPRDFQKRQMVTVVLKERKWIKFALTVSQRTTVAEAEELMRMNASQLENTHVVFYAMQSQSGINDEIVLLRPTDFIVQGVKDVFAVEVEHDPSSPKTKFVVVYNRTKISRSCSIPMVFSVNNEATLTTSWLQKDALKSTIEMFFTNKQALATAAANENGEEPEKEPYRIFYAGRNAAQTPLTLNGNEPLGFPQGVDNYVAYQQISFFWKDVKLFSGNKGAELIERELSTATRKKVDLIETIEWFTTKEQLGEQDLWYCPNCKKLERATKKLDLWALPDYLVLHLKRFNYTRWSRDKITWDVTIPVKGFDLTDKIANKEHGSAVYDLIGMSIHKGQLTSGHYVTNAINSVSGGWCQFNDGYAGFITPPRDPYSSPDPYLLVYKKRKEGAADTDDEDMGSVHHDVNMDVEMEED